MLAMHHSLLGLGFFQCELIGDVIFIDIADVLNALFTIVSCHQVGEKRVRVFRDLDEALYWVLSESAST
jgi:hypothetical protein